MISGSGGSTTQLLHHTIRVLCGLIEQRVHATTPRHWAEIDLRRELVTCILGSQVRFETAASGTRSLEQEGLLADRWWCDRKTVGFAQEVFEVLDARRHTVPPSGRHRFARSRSRQLDGARIALAETALKVRLSGEQDAKSLRKNLVADIPGIGPKQASMFLRNIGRSYELAILDSHVLTFIHTLDPYVEQNIRIETARGYEKAERILVDYAEDIGFRPGYVDWAIWATMKAARELAL